jgi:hypothetical protein
LTTVELLPADGSTGFDCGADDEDHAAKDEPGQEIVLVDSSALVLDSWVVGRTWSQRSPMMPNHESIVPRATSSASVIRRGATC